MTNTVKKMIRLKISLYRHMKGYRLKCLGSLSSYSQRANVAGCCYIILVHSKGVFGPQSGSAS